MGVDVDFACAFGFGCDLAGFAYGRNFLVVADVTQRRNVLAWHEFLALLQFHDLRLDFEGLAFFEGDFCLLHDHGFSVGVSLRVAGRVDVRQLAGLDVFLLAVFHGVRLDEDLVGLHLFQAALRPQEFLAGFDGFDLLQARRAVFAVASAEVDVIACSAVYLVP